MLCHHLRHEVHPRLLNSAGGRKDDRFLNHIHCHPYRRFSCQGHEHFMTVMSLFDGCARRDGSVCWYLFSGLQNCHQITIEFAMSGGLLSHLAKVFDKVPDEGQQRLTPLNTYVCCINALLRSRGEHDAKSEDGIGDERMNAFEHSATRSTISRKGVPRPAANDFGA